MLNPQPQTTEAVAPRVWSAPDELVFVDARRGVANPDIAAASVGALGELRQIVTTDFMEVDPALSPNGRWLAYVSTRTGRGEIWVQGYPEGVAVRVSTNGGYEPQWSADGRELYYLQGNAMMAVAVETDGEFSFGAPAQLFAGRYFVAPGAVVSSYDVAGDGRFLMIEPPGASTEAAPASIVVVENWAEELKRLVRTD